jgi:hypothetical protein
VSFVVAVMAGVLVLGAGIAQADGPAVVGVSPQSGLTSGGTAVRLFGSGLSNPQSVSIGSTALLPCSMTSGACYTPVSDNEVDVVTPSSASTGQVDTTVTTASGTSATSAPDQFTYAEATPYALQVIAASDTRVALTWKAPAISGITGYNVYRGGTKIGSTDADTANYVDTSVSANGAYSYYVTAQTGPSTETGASATVSASTTAAATPVTQCETLSAPGSYAVTSGVAAVPGEVCLDVTAPNVSIDCAGNSIVGGIAVSGADFMVTNCGFPDAAGIFANGVSNGVVADDTFTTILQFGAGVQLTNSSNVVVTGDVFVNTVCLTNGTSDSYIGHNMLAVPNLTDIGTLIGDADGVRNTIVHNEINGYGQQVGYSPGLGGPAPEGSDDGITAEGFDPAPTTGDVIADNAIENVWDAGIETAGFAANMTIRGNSVNTAYVTAVGAYSAHNSSWVNNQVANNQATDAGTLFHVEVGTPTAFQPQAYLAFNTFTGNTYTQPSGSDVITSPASRLEGEWQGEPTVALGNVVNGNRFGMERHGPSDDPGGMAAGSGNVCSAGGDPDVRCDGEFAGAPVVASVSPSAASDLGGTSVTIQGSGLSDATGVAFYNGGSSPTATVPPCPAASGPCFTVVSDSEITLPTPPAAPGDGSVSVLSDFGASAPGLGSAFNMTAETGVFQLGTLYGPLAGGGQVTIYGYGLLDATSVAFGDQAEQSCTASGPPCFTANSDSQIVATPPAASSPGLVDVRVTIDGQQTPVSPSDQYDYQSAPVVSGLSTSSGPATGGTLVTLTGSGFSGAFNVGVDRGDGTHTPGDNCAEYAGEPNPPPCFTVVSDSEITFVTPGVGDVPGLHAIEVMTAGGTSAATQQSTFDFIAAPGAPTITDVSPWASYTPVISGDEADNAATVQVMIGAVPICSAAVQNGSWSCQPSTALPPEAPFDLVAVATDPVGGTTMGSVFVWDPTATAPPAVQPPRIIPWVLPSPSNNNEPLIYLTEADSTATSVTVYANGQALCTAPAAPGWWSCTPPGPMADGDYTLTAVAENAQGEVSPTSDPVDLVIDTTPPPAPTLTGPTSPSASGLPTFTGVETEDGDSIQVDASDSSGTVALCDTTSSGGAWSCTPSTPLADGTYSLSVVASDGAGNHAYSAAVSFVVSKQPPTCTPSPAAAQTDVGSAVTFTAGCTGGTGALTYQWTVNGSPTGAAGTSNSVYLGSAGTITVGVTATDSLNESGSGTATATAVNSPTCAPTTTTPQTDENVNATFAANCSGGTGALSYQWSVNGVAQGATGSSFGLSEPATGSYTVSVTATDAVGGYGSGSATDTVVSPPACGPSSAQTDVNRSVTFTANCSGGTGNLSYQWYVNGSARSGATGSSLALTEAVAGTYTVSATATDAVGGSGSGSGSDKVVSGPSCSVSPTAQTDVNRPVSFRVTSCSGGTGAYSYQWAVNNVAQSGATGTSFSFSEPTAQTYGVEMTVTDAVGGTSVTPTAAIIVSSPACTVTPSPTQTDTNISATFTANCSGGTGGYQYQWSVNGVAQGATGSSFGLSEPTSGTYSVSVTATDVVGGSGSGSATDTVVNPPVCGPGSGQIDVNRSVTFTANCSGGTGNLAYQWYVNGSARSGATGSSLALTEAVAGTYTVSVTATDAVGGSGSGSGSDLVVSGPSCSVSPTAQTDVNEPVSFRVTSCSGGTGAYSYQWAVNNVAQSGATGTSFSFSEPTAQTYGVEMTVTDAVGGTSVAPTAAIIVAPPSCTALPSLTVDLGQAATYTASCSGGTGGYLYQWSINGTQQSGATGSTFSPSTAAVTSGETISLGATDVVGGTGGVSGSLKVNSALSCSAPASVAVTPTASASFATSCSGGTTGYVYQWQVSSNGGSSWSNDTSDSGATTGSLTVASTSPNYVSGDEFRVTITDASSSPSPLTPAAATLTLNKPPAITTQPAAASAVVGSSATFMAAASGTPAPSVQWQVAPVVAAFTATETKSSTTLSAVSSFTNIAVGSFLTGANIPAGTTVVSVNTSAKTLVMSAAATAAATGASIVPATFANDTTDTGDTTGTLTVASLKSTQNGNQYRAVFTNSLGSATTAAAKLTVTGPTLSGISPSSGPTGGGGYVAISGTGLNDPAGLSSVTFGSTAATSLKVLSAGELIAVAPSGTAGASTVTVKFADGLSATTSFTYLAVPTVTAVSPTSGTTAGGTSVTLTGTGFTGATQVWFGSALATSVTVNSSTSITAVSPPQAGATNIKVVAPGGTSATGTGNAYTYTGLQGGAQARSEVVGYTCTASGQPTITQPVAITAQTPFAVAVSKTVAVTGGALAAPLSTASAGSGGVLLADGGTQFAESLTALSLSTSGAALSFPGAPYTFANVSLAPGAGLLSGWISQASWTSGPVSVGSFTGPASGSATVTPGNVSLTVTASGGSAPASVSYACTPPTGTAALTSVPVEGAPTVTKLSPTSGSTSGGTVVTITGTNFTGASGVTFGGKAATNVNVASSTSITATSPAGTGTVDVQVTTQSGTSATGSADKFVY